MTTMTEQLATMPLLKRMRATRLPPPERRRYIREQAGASREDVARELERRGCRRVSEAAIRWWEKPRERGGVDPRPAIAIAYGRLLDELLAEIQQTENRGQA